jgi:VCBS repeat-containing protein
MAKIKGNGADNTLTGTAANDKIKGYGGNDVLDGLGGNDKLDGGKGNDELVGGLGNDRLKGGKGDDLLFGGAGNDEIDGGKGFDTAVFGGTIESYSLSFKSHGDMKGTVIGPDGTDRLMNVELLRFDNALYDVASNTVHHSPTTSPVTLSPIAEDSGARLITQAELLANASDVDGPALSAINLAIATGNGSLIDNGDGTWSYTPAPNDDTAATFSYQVTDGIAPPAAGAASLDITPVNDPAVVTGDAAGGVTEDGVLADSGNLDAADIDNPADAWQAVAAPAASANGYGTYTLTADGVWTYNLDNGHAAVQALNTGETLSDSFTAYTADGTAQSVSVTINGADEPDILIPDGTLDVSARDPLSPGNIYPGAGNTATGWAIVRDVSHDLELGIHVKYRSSLQDVNPTSVEPDGTVKYTVDDGPQLNGVNGASGTALNRAAWSFDYSASTALDGSVDTLADFNFRLLIDLNPGAGTSFLELAFSPVGGLPDAPGEPRSNGLWSTAAPMAGIPAVGTGLIADDGGTDQVTQNSQNYAFYSTIMDFDGNPATDDAAVYTFTPGVFDIYLQAFDSSNTVLLAQNHVQVTVA